MDAKWTFYGSTEPKALVATPWLLFLALPAVAFFSVRIENGHQVILIYSIIAGLITLAGAVKLRSWLLILIGLFTIAFYAYFATLFFGVVP